MYKVLYYFLKILIAVVLGCFAVFLGWKIYRSWSDPIATLKKRVIRTQVIYENTYLASDSFSKRVFTDIVLNTGGAGNALFSVSLPEKIPKEGLKCIFVAAGMDTGQQSLRYIDDHSGYAIVAYEYPAIIRALKKRSAIFHIRAIQENLLLIPQQWVSIVLWIKKQSWCKSGAVSLAGFSFGSIFIPAAYHLAQAEKIPLAPGIIAYGGAGIYCLLKVNLEMPAWIKIPAAWIGSILFRPIDPLVHAKFLQNTFLIINGLYDAMVPPDCRKKMQEIIPEPKEIMNLHTEHMQPGNTALLRRLVQISKQFLQNQNVANSEITPEANAMEFLPNTVNQTPPITPNLELKLYSKAGAS